MRKAQVGLEFILVIVIGLAFLIPISYLMFSYSADSIRTSKAYEVVESVAKAVDHVYSLGPGSQTYIEVLIPDGVYAEKCLVENNTIRLSVRLFSGYADAIATTKAKVLGYLPTTPGTHEVLIRALRSGYVQVGEILVANPELISDTISPGSFKTESVTLRNKADFKVEGIQALGEGEIGDWVTISGVPSELDANSQASFSVKVTVPASQPTGIYEGLVFINSTNGGETQIFLNISVS